MRYEIQPKNNSKSTMIHFKEEEDKHIYQELFRSQLVERMGIKIAYKFIMNEKKHTL